MRVAAGCCAVVIATSGVARAEPACSGPKLVLEPSLSHRRAWSDAALDARRKVAELTDVDACTRLEVGRAGHAIQVKASAADGRSVVRDLSGPGELEPTVVALLVLPPHGEQDDDLAAVSPREKPADPVKPATKPVAAAAATQTASTAADQGVSDGPARPYARRSLEVAVGGSARSAAYLLGPSVGVLVNARLDGWLIGGVAHAEQTSTSNASTTQFTKERSASVGFVLGRRLSSGPVYLDVALEAPILAVSTSTWTAEVTEGDDDDQEPLEPGSDDQPASTSSTHSKEKVLAPHADLRAGGLVRAVMPFGAGFGAFCQLDAEHTLGVLPQPSAEGQPRTIGWNAGLSLGLFWSSL